MRISDAEVGDVLMDGSGALWVRGTAYARCVYDPNGDSQSGDGESWGAVPVLMAEVEWFGPFTRLVPEPTNAK